MALILIKLGVLKVWKCYKSVALEIATLLFMASVLMTYLLTQDLLIGRVCLVNLEYSEEICNAVVQNTGNYTDEESNIQKVMAQIRKTRSLLDYSIPIVFVLFQGSWSDIHGRKLPLLLPCLGFIAQALALFMSLYFKEWGAYTVVLISTIPKCLSGSDVTFRMAALSYISDISTNRGRTLRTGLLSAAFTLGVPVGFALGGGSVKASVPLAYALLCSAGICAVAFFNILLFVDNKPKKFEGLEIDGADKSGKTSSSSNETMDLPERKCFSFKNIKSVFKSLAFSFDEATSLSTRIQIFVLIVVIVCVNAPIQGEFGVMYLYLRKKLMWDSGDYGMFSTYVSLVGVLGTLLSMGLLCRLLKFSDPLIGFIAGISQFGGSFMYAFAQNSLMIYLAPTIDMLNGTMAVVAKSMLSKFCSPENFGKMFSLLAVIELLVPLAFDPIYSTLYEHTLDYFPGMVFILSAVMTIPPQIAYAFYIWRESKSDSCTITECNPSVPNSKYNANITSENNVAGHLEFTSEFGKGSAITLKSASSTSTVNSVISTA